MNRINKSKITLIEAFGGIGTFRKALENIGFDVETREYIEWWKYAVEAYNALHSNNKICKDIKNFNWEVDIFAHGSPCTDFSQAGCQDISKGRSILYQEVLRLINDLPFKIRPKIIVWENVKNLVSKKFKSYFDYYINQLSELGYNSTWKILNSKNFGIPQSRERVFVISIKNNQQIYFDWENIETVQCKPLSYFLQNFKEINNNLWFTNKKLEKAIDKSYYKKTEWVFNENGFCYLPLSARNSDNKVSERTIASLQANNNQTKVLIPLTKFKSANNIGVNQTRTLCGRDYKSPAQVLIPLEYEEYSNYLQLPRELDGKAKSINKANGAYNRYWKSSNLIGTLPSKKIQNILFPLKINKYFNYKNKAQIFLENDYKQESKIFQEKQDTIFDTLTTNFKSNKIAKEINNDLTMDFCIKNNIAIFSIENKLYAIRHLSHIEYWRLMGWEDKDILKVSEKISKSKMYFLAGNAIVIQVLEAIFKELLKNFKN